MSDAPTSPEPDTPPPTRVFLSYSRKDEVFMRRLAAALHERGYAPDFDQSDYDPDNISGGISAEDEWWQRLEQMIVAADVMVFIVSPDSAASKVCDEEIAFAREVGKRLIPIECRPINYAEAPPRLAAQNVKIKFNIDGEDRFQEALDALCAAIDVDIAWHRENRRSSRRSCWRACRDWSRRASSTSTPWQQGRSTPTCCRSWWEWRRGSRGAGAYLRLS